jgi:signal transduction histidine kinase
MSDAEERFRKFRHDISNPLSALLAETQLLLLRADSLDNETVKSLQDIEALARRMRDLLQQHAPRSQ